jgi:hypothetical protein
MNVIGTTPNLSIIASTDHKDSTNRRVVIMKEIQ